MSVRKSEYADWDRDRRAAFPEARHDEYDSWAGWVRVAHWSATEGRCWIECDEEPRKKIGGTEG